MKPALNYADELAAPLTTNEFNQLVNLFAEAQREARAEAFEEAAQLLWERALPTVASYDIAKAIRALAAKVTP
jgi:hypothetical protein